MKRLSLLLVFILFYSCAKEEFVPPKDLDKSTTASVQGGSEAHATGRSTVRPPVDFLFLWDNSTSSVFINDAAKNALKNLLTNISDRYDYNVMMAPLLIGNGQSVNSEAVFFNRPCSVGQTDILDRSCDNPAGPGNGITMIHQSTASNALDTFTKQAGSAEKGVSRAVDILAANQSNGVFRDGAYTIVVLMSNDDDKAWVDPNADFEFNPHRMDSYTKAKAHDLLCMRGNYSPSNLYNSTFSRFSSNCSNAPRINSLMMRFISISALFPANSCSIASYLTQNNVYKNVSAHVHNQPYTNNFTFPAMSSNNYEERSDAYNICRGDYNYLFDSINNTITDATIAHVYRYLKIADAGVEVDPSSITITRSDGVSFSQIPNDRIISRDNYGKNDVDQNGSPVHGFRFINGTQTLNTRFLPIPGEQFTGQFVELFGNAKLTYPQSMISTYQEPQSYFGYVHLANRPLESEIEVKINGSVVPNSSVSGWTLLKDGAGSPMYYSSFNIKIQSPTNFSQKTPGDYRSGYFLRLTSDRVYSNNQTIEVKYQRAPQ